MKTALYRLLGLIALTAGLALPIAAHADVVTSWHDDVRISHDNVVTVAETIVYDPQDNSHHGIERTIPATFTGSGHTYYTRVMPVSVNDATGTPYHLASEAVGRNQLYLKIGNASETITGPHTYVITYTIAPLVQTTGDHDRFIFNVVGTQWDTAIEQMSAAVHYPSAQSISTSACYTGAAGSTANNCTISAAGTIVSAQLTQPLQAGEAFTVDLTTPPGSVTSYLQPDKPLPLSPAERLNRILAAAAGALLILSVLRLLYGALADWRRRKQQTVIAQYEAPDGLTPAQLNMIDKASQPKMVAATLIDLAVRGYLKIDILQTKSLFRQANYRFTMLKTADGLQPYETDLFSAIFASTNTVEMKDLKNRPTQMSQAIQKLRKDLGADLKAKGYFAASPTNQTKSLSWGLGVITIFLIIVGLSTAGTNVHQASWLLAGAVAVGAITLIISLLRSGRTPLGDAEWAKVEGFKLFLNVTEKDRLAFTDAPAKTPQLFSALLPAAIALGAEKQWAAQFTGIDIGPAVGGWYGGYTGVLYADSFGSDFSSSFAGAVSSSFAGSSGSGGAGGGGGGGGGGGW